MALAMVMGCAEDADFPHEATSEADVYRQIEQPVHSVCAPPETVEGIDVSVYQGNIDWDMIKATGRMKFAYIRNSHGLGTTDTQFARNWAEAKRVGIPRGAYQYFDPEANALAQAQRYMELVNAQGGYLADDLPPMIDVEDTGGASPATIVANVRIWIDHVEAETGKAPIIYTGSYFWDDNVGSDAFSDYYLWTAHYTGGDCALTSSAWDKWLIWQFTSTETIPGITANTVDVNRFAGTQTDLDNWPRCSKDIESCGENGVTIETSWASIPGQDRDLVPEGSSAGKFDFVVGQSTDGLITIRNGSGRPATDDMIVGYWLEAPYLQPTSYTIETSSDGANFVASTQNGRADNPDASAPPSSGNIRVGPVQPGETVRIRFSVEATQYSVGVVDHPDLRGWVKHIGNYYGEQDGWNDDVEVNQAGRLLRSFVESDVFSPQEWQFNGGDGADLEGWTPGSDVEQLAINTLDNAMAIKASGVDPWVKSPEWTYVDASSVEKLLIRHRQHGGPRTVQLFWAAEGEGFGEDRSVQFDVVGDGDYQLEELDLSANPSWTGVVTQLRLDSWNGGPFTGAEAWYDIDYIRFVTSEVAILDNDGDGYLADVDCDDDDAGVYPGATEICDQKDNDCDNELDEGDACTPMDEAPTDMSMGTDMSTGDMNVLDSGPTPTDMPSQTDLSSDLTSGDTGEVFDGDPNVEGACACRISSGVGGQTHTSQRLSVLLSVLALLGLLARRLWSRRATMVGS